MKELEYTVFPSLQKTIEVDDENCNNYAAKVCLGYKDGDTFYGNSSIYVNFVHIDERGEFEPGLQNEQLAYILLDRTMKLNEKFPSSFNDKMIRGLEYFIQASQDRIQDRIERGVMGQLKK